MSSSSVVGLGRAPTKRHTATAGTRLNSTFT